MPAQKIQGSQHDFSSGEVDLALKRADDHPARKTGLRQMSNMRILNPGGIQNRSGRSALFPAPNTRRIEKVTMSPGNDFFLSFGNGSLTIFNSAGSQVATFVARGGGGGAALPWSLATAGQVVYCQIGLSIYLTFPGMRPQVISWDGVATWTGADFTELVIGGQKRTPFYRLSPQGITLLPGAQTGSGVSLVASAAVFKAGHVGTRMRFVGRQMLITGVSNSTNATVTIEESLPGSQALHFLVDPRTSFSIGDVINGSVSGAKGIVTALGSDNAGVQLLSGSSVSITNQFGLTELFAFTEDDIAVGPGGGVKVNSADAIGNPVAVPVWDEEVMNDLQGYPASCFADQFRLGFCNFPAVPGGVGWSAINSPTDLYVVGATLPNGGIFEVAPDKVRVQYVVPGPESSEFVFCDKKLYYIKIDATNPLKSGSVSFQLLSGDGCAAVQPRVAQDLILYVNGGGNTIMAILAPGAYYRPFTTKDLCDFHSHLFNNIAAIAIPTGDGAFNERYAYVLNGDGTMAVGKYNLKDGQLGDVIGWGPWSGAGAVQWVSAFGPDVLFTSTYFGTFTMCEVLNDAVYMDGTVPVNALPAAMAAPVGKGPLWWAAGQSVSLMDQVTRSMGVYQIDANGNIIAQNNGGENLAIASLMAGLAWAAMIEPFAPDAQSGADAGQRMDMRSFKKFAVYLVHSTGLVFATLFSGKLTRSSPSLGIITNSRRVPAYNMDDDTTQPPPSRETAEFYTPVGSTYDPRAAVIHDTPGPLQILEFAMEVST